MAGRKTRKGERDRRDQGSDTCSNLVRSNEGLNQNRGFANEGQGRTEDTLGRMHFITEGMREGNERNLQNSDGAHAPTGRQTNSGFEEADGESGGGVVDTSVVAPDTQGGLSSIGVGGDIRCPREVK